MNFLRQSLSHLIFISMMMASTLPLTLILIAPSTDAHADNILAKEYFVKAAFLYNFARLVEWPATTFITKDTPFRLCLIGDDPFGNALHSIRNKKVNGHPLIIQRDIILSDASQCQILFISLSEKKNTADILTTLNHAPVLTVSEASEFAEQEGHIRLFLAANNKLSLEVNLDAINKAGLTISSRILTLAKIVSTKGAIKP